tara:strand:- start:202 stop:429 length:228 start_codon:yes stop_codon:yes gene_type:complete
MKELQEVRNEVLHLKNMGVINKQEETKLLHKLNALEKAISVTRCCESVKGRKDHNIDIAYNGYCTKCTSRENKAI